MTLPAPSPVLLLSAVLALGATACTIVTAPPPRASKAYAPPPPPVYPACPDVQSRAPAADDGSP